MTHQSLSETAPDLVQQFKHNLSVASTARAEKMRKDALAFLTTQLSAHPPNNPVGTLAILSKVLPLVSDISPAVRSQLLLLLQALPEQEVKPHAERAIMYVRAGMTHLSSSVSKDSLNFLDWILRAAPEEVVSCPGGWVKTLNGFCAMMGWSATGNHGWSAGPKTGTKTKDALSHARNLTTLAHFLEAGLRPEISEDTKSTLGYWDNLYRSPRMANPFAYLNLFGKRKDEDDEMYADRESRQRVFHKRYLELVIAGSENAKKEGGAAGRAASALDQVLKIGLADYEVSASIDDQELHKLW
jgi:pre-rRNA-processing protein IPI1